MKKSILFRWTIISVIVFAICFNVKASDQVVTNNADAGAGSLRQALLDVSSGGTITFNLSSGNETIIISSELAVPKPMTIDGGNTAGSGISVTVKVPVSGSSAYRVYSIDAGSTVNIVDIRNMTIQGGHGNFGGAIYVRNSTLNLNTVTISDSKAYQAGGVYVYSCNLNMTNCICSNNSTDGAGSESHGGFSYSLGSTITITSCTFTGNSAQVAGAVFNGGSGGSLTVNSCVFTNNNGTAGGAIYNEGTTKIYNSTINGNTSTGDGGAMQSWGTLYVVSSTITGNTAHNGGGVYAGGTSYFVNSTISGNTASSTSGGGIYENGMNMYILNSMIINNTASTGADLQIYAGNAYAYYSWYNGVSGSVNVQASAPNVTTVYTSGNLGPLANNGGPTQTMALSTSSPAAGTGTFVYYNSTDGYYFLDNLSTPVSHKLNSWATHPSVVAGNKITLDQRGVTISTPPCMGAYDEPFSATWTGSSSTDWSDASNWSPAEVPTWVVNVVIPDVTNLPFVTATAASPATCKNLTINADAALNIGPGKALTVSGTLTNNAGTTGLYIGSGPTVSGSLKQSSGSVSATVERDITAWSDAAHGWHFLSSPVASQSISPAFTDGTPANYDFYSWWEPTSIWVNYKNTTVSPTWSEGNILGETSGAGNFIPGKGYLVAYASTATKQFSGTLNVADITLNNFSLSTGSNYGWHLLGNPFPCALKWNDGNWGTLTAVTGTAKIWNEGNASYTDISANGIIPAMNGFMIEVTNAINTLTIPLAARTHGTTDWYKSSSDYPYVKLVAHDPAGQTAQESVIRFIPDATNGFDQTYDAHYLAGYAPNFYSVSGSEHLSTNTLPESGGAIHIPFNFLKNDGVNFIIEAREISDIYGPVFLNDLKTGTSQDLTTNPEYSFTASAGDVPERFVINFSQVGINETPSEDPIQIYANNNSIYVANSSGLTITGDIFVYNLMGQQLMQTRLSGTTLTKINLNSPAGYYLVKVITGQKTYSGKVFIR